MNKKILAIIISISVLFFCCLATMGVVVALVLSALGNSSNKILAQSIKNSKEVKSYYLEYKSEVKAHLNINDVDTQTTPTQTITGFFTKDYSKADFKIVQFPDPETQIKQTTFDVKIIDGVGYVYSGYGPEEVGLGYQKKSISEIKKLVGEDGSCDLLALMDEENVGQMKLVNENTKTLTFQIKPGTKLQQDAGDCVLKTIAKSLYPDDITGLSLEGMSYQFTIDREKKLLISDLLQVGKITVDRANMTGTFEDLKVSSTVSKQNEDFAVKVPAAEDIIYHDASPTPAPKVY